MGCFYINCYNDMGNLRAVRLDIVTVKHNGFDVEVRYQRRYVCLFDVENTIIPKIVWT